MMIRACLPSYCYDHVFSEKQRLTNVDQKGIREIEAASVKQKFYITRTQKTPISIDEDSTLKI